MRLAFEFNYGPITSSGSGPRIVNSDTMRAVTSGTYAAVAPNDEFSEYESYDCPDWDGYGAQPILQETVRAARSLKRLLPADGPWPDIAPGADGTIGFEWRYGPAEQREFTLIDVGPGYRIMARKIAVDGTVKHFPPTKITTGARALINELFAP